jgi:hypothetical protein
VELRWQSVSVERDEDLEITIPDRRIYVQIKKRAGNLTYSDIGDTLARCAEIRAEHRAGRRQSAADFWVVCNSEPGPKLSPPQPVAAAHGEEDYRRSVVRDVIGDEVFGLRTLLRF